MSDDIVTRLRENAAHLVNIGYTSDAEEITQAIDEIERLKAERDHYKRIAEEAVSNLEQAVKLLQAFQAAVHD